MAHGFRRRGERYAAKLDGAERSVVIGLMEQVRDLLAPSTSVTAGDTFEDIVSGLGGLMGVSVAAEDLDDGDGPPSTPPDAGRDPALDRLLPVANRTDDDAAREFRRLTEATLRRTKARHLATAISALARADGAKVDLSEAEATAVVIALTDVRLVLGERIGLRTDADVDRLEVLVTELDDDDPLAYALAVYDFLTWLQESLSLALMPE